jgi:predicted AAA+ superfamily ATPase
MKNIKRYLQIKLSPGQSVFLWGARKTGKSTFPKKIILIVFIMTFSKPIYFWNFPSGRLC